ncbi:hypothetical protein [Sphingopyxis sp.]|uniref:hypothetical protein n=1 Tax=Sphingopyxis sp. TaxID=1908224 RepID=UPI003F705A60
MTGSLKLEGFAELEQIFAQFEDPRVAERIGSRAGNGAMKYMLSAIVADLPVGTRPTLRKRKRKDGSVAEADYGRVTTNVAIKKIRKSFGSTAQVWTVSTNAAFWWWMNEFGTVNQPANPVVRKAWEREAPSLPDRIGKDLWAGVQRAAKSRGVNVTGRST